MRLPVRLALLWVTSKTYAAETPAPLTREETVSARKVYVSKCAKCHQFYEPLAYTDAAWHTWMEKMSKKSKLKPAQEILLNRYLDAYRAGKLPGKPQDKPAPAPKTGRPPR